MMKIFGITIKREIGLTALLGMITSIGVGAFQLFMWLTVSEVFLFPPKQIYIGVFYPDNKPFDQESEKDGYVKFATNMTYVVKVPPPSNAFITKESISISVAGEIYEHLWFQFAEFDYPNWDRPSFVDDAQIFTVTGENVESHETFFTAYPVNCNGCERYQNFLLWSHLKSILEDTEPTSINFIMSGFLLTDEVVTSNCRIVLTQSLKHSLYQNGWVRPYCQI